MPRERTRSSFFKLHDYETHAKQNLSKMVFDFVAGGACDEVTLRKNREAFDQIRLNPRILAGQKDISTRTQILGQEIAFPAIISPIAFHGLVHKQGELATARAAQTAATIFVSSIASNYPVEEITAQAPERVWFQINFYKDQELTKKFVKRAETSGCKALVVTVDSATTGRRERDLANSFHLPKSLEMANFKKVGVKRELKPKRGGSALVDFRKEFVKPGPSWRDFEWLRGQTKLPVIVKGIMRPDDAIQAVRLGANAVWISNHGGRQLDTTAPSITVLPKIAEALGGQAEIIFDSGVRRGTDIVKAIALGATCVGIGRPIIWGLAESGERGAARVLQILKDELENAMAILGCDSVGGISRDFVDCD